MLLTVFLAIVFCAAISLMLLSAVAFIQDKKFFSSAPKEAQEVVLPREKELFYGARVIGWTLMIFSFLIRTNEAYFPPSSISKLNIIRVQPMTLAP